MIRLLHGSCLDVLPTLPADSIDSAVTDPPYHLTSIVKRFGKTGPTTAGVVADRLRAGADGYARTARGFMSQQWDGGDIAFRSEVWTEVYRVLKPGAYLVSFASTRGYHRMVCAIEDAGFIIHPMLGWIFASGFPKAHKVEAEGWEGWRYGLQSLKPALEPICPCSRKSAWPHGKQKAQFNGFRKAVIAFTGFRRVPCRQRCARKPLGLDPHLLPANPVPPRKVRAAGAPPPFGRGNGHMVTIVLTVLLQHAGLARALQVRRADRPRPSAGLSGVADRHCWMGPARRSLAGAWRGSTTAPSAFPA